MSLIVKFSVLLDSQLASHIGSYLINHNKELEMLVTTTENCAEEQKLRADVRYT